MAIDKQIALKLLFEHYRTTLAAIAIEEMTDDEVIFEHDICLHGSNIFDLTLGLLGIDLTDSNYDYYYIPFLDIVKKHLPKNGVNKELNLYLEWLTNNKLPKT